MSGRILQTKKFISVDEPETEPVAALNGTVYSHNAGSHHKPETFTLKTIRFYHSGEKAKMSYGPFNTAEEALAYLDGCAVDMEPCG